jgi:hypothetical protein
MKVQPGLKGELKMRRHFPLLPIILLMLCAAEASAQNAVDNAGASFQISSIKSPFAFAGVFDGEYQVRPESIEITISKADISLRDNCPYRGRRQLAFINIALATTDANGKKTVIAHARAIPVGETMSPGDNYLAEKMRFSIPKEKGLDLSTCWLVVEMGELTLDSNDDDKVGYAFAPSDRNIFAPLLVKAAKK